MRRIIALGVLLFLATMMRGAPRCSAESVRERLQRAVSVSEELSASAHSVDEARFRSVAPTPLRCFPDLSGITTPDSRSLLTSASRAFPRASQIISYENVRPWQAAFWKAWAPREARSTPQRALPVSWPTQADARELRRLLEDRDPGIRSLAAEALSVLSQPEDVPRIARLLDDDAQGTLSLEWNMPLNAVYIGIPKNESDPIDLLRSWRRLSVSTYAQRALWYMTGRKLDATGFPEWWERNKDFQSSLWYWQQRIQRGAIGVDLRELTPEVEAKIKLLALPTSDPQTRFQEPNMYTPLNLRLNHLRLLDLMDKKDLWKDVDWEVGPELDRSSGYYFRMVERMARASDELFTHSDAGRLRGVLDRGKTTRSCRVELIKGIARLLPSSGAASLNDANTRDGFIRSRILVEEDEYTRGEIAAELVRTGLPDNWPFLREEFFRNATIDNSGAKYLALVALGTDPLTPSKRAALVDLLLDERYLPLWKMTQMEMGGDLYRRGACLALNAHAGREIITPREEHALPRSDEALDTVLGKVRELGEAR